MATSNIGLDNPIGDKTLANLDEVVEGDRIGSRNYRFAPVGAHVPIRPDFRYNPEAPPSQPLAVSQQFHLLFVAHSDGFYVVKTEEAMIAAEMIKEEGSGPTIQEICMLDIPLGKVSVLTLSSDDSMLAASVENELHFFSIGALLHKDKNKSYSISLDESDCIKDVKWIRKAEKSYLVLSNDGNLYIGSGRGTIKSLMVNVDAVECSAKGDFVAVARKNILSILSLELVEKCSFSLLPKSLIVDSIRWPRPDSIILGGSPTDDEGYLVLVVNMHDRGIIDGSCKPVVVSFNDMFLDFQSEVIIGCSGPNLLLSYLDHQEVAFIANKKNLFEHVVLLGWSLEDKKNTASIVEISNDAWFAHIESQENDEDNSVLGLSIDKVSQNNKLKFLLGEDETEVSPCSVLICLTIDGKLALFHFASAIGYPVSSADLSDSVGEENASQKFGTEENVSLVCSSYDREKIEAKIDLNFSANVASRSEIKGSGEVRTGISEQSNSSEYNRRTAESISFTREKPVLHFQPVKDDEEQKLPTMKLNKDRSTQLSVSEEKSGSESEQSLFKTSQIVGSGIVGQNANEAKTHEFAEAIPHVDSSSGKQLMDLSSQTMTKNMQFSNVQYPDKAAPSNSETAPSFSWSSGKTAPSKNTNERSSSITTGNIDRKSSGSLLQFSKDQFQYPSQVIEAAGTSGPINSSGQKAPLFAGNVFGGSQLLSQQNIASGRFSKSQSSEESSTICLRAGSASSEHNLPKQLHNVEDMAKQMDRLLEGIQRTGGFKDASITHLKNSVETLEEGLWNLSESRSTWRGVMDEKLKEIQLLLDKTVEVLARKIYIRGVLKQATDTQYWDLWNCQKLSSELEMKRQHILEVNQGLTIQLLELEKHLNTIELSKFGERGGFQENQRAARSRHGNTRQFQSLHSLHNTMGAQLAAAEKLSECLSKQMSALSIESPVKNQNVKKELFETIGLTYDAATPYSSPCQDCSFSSPGRNRLSISSSFSTAVKEESKKYQVTPVKISEPETVRRHRESLDQSLSRYEPPKTTVKRILLQEDSKKAGTSKSLFRMDEHLNVQKNVSTVIHSSLTAESARPTHGSKNQVIPSTQTKQPVKHPSKSLFQWADSTENFHPSLQQPSSTKTAALGSTKDVYLLSDERSKSNLSLNRTNSSNLGDSRSVVQSEVQYRDSLAKATVDPLEMTQSYKKWIASPDFSVKEYGSSEPHSSEIHTIPESGSSKTSAFPASTFGSNYSFSGKISQVKTSAPESHPIETVSSTSAQSSSILSSSIHISNTTSSSSKVSVPASSSVIPSSKWDTSPHGNADANQNTSHPKALASSFTFSSSISVRTSKDGIISSTSADAMNEISTSTESASQSNVSLLGTKSNENPMIPNTISSSSLTVDNFRTQLSVSQPELPSAASDLKSGQAMPFPITAELVSSLKSQNQTNVGRISSSVMDLTSNDKSEQPSAFQFNPVAEIQSSEISNDGKIGSFDVITQEDEMEEEAPESDLGIELSMGNLSGFGIGSIPDSSTVKRNPFGLGVLNNAAATPVVSPFTPPAPTGELFRPASFKFEPQPSQQPANMSVYPSGFGTGSTNQVSTGAGFGQPSQFGPGPQALGSVLGSFGQSRQLGTSLPASGVASPIGGFAPSSGGGFSGLASSGPVGFAGAGFAGAGAGNPGLGGFSNQQNGGGFSPFGNSSVSGRPTSDLFTQMRR